MVCSFHFDAALQIIDQSVLYGIALLCVQCMVYSFHLNAAWQIKDQSVLYMVLRCCALANGVQFASLPCITGLGTRCTRCFMDHPCPVTKTRNMLNL